MKLTIRTFIALIILSLCCLSNAQDRRSKSLFVVIVDDKRGYIDQNGKIVIKPQFEGASDFSEGLAVISTSENGYKQGYIDEAGSIVIRPQFDRALDFSEGLAAVGFGEFQMHGGGDHIWGFIDKSGRLVISARFHEAGGFSEGLCVVVNREGKRGYIDKTGRLLIPYKYTWASGFSEGLACVNVGDHFGFIDKTGKMIIEPKFTDPGGFREGLALTRIGGKTIDPRPGALIGGPLGGRLVYIDKSGKTIIELDEKIDEAHPFSEGLAPVGVIKNDGYLYLGYIDRTGQFAIEPRFGGADKFSGGFARILLNGKWGLIDKTGEILFQTEFSLMMEFNGGLAQVFDGEDLPSAKIGYIDRAGKVIWRPSK
ncbi:MAG TPA: WG repeat-containing protein [Blastocatellia bacterium]|nr:WG repeat-containing protein [Blastocatellia bacterium]